MDDLIQQLTNLLFNEALQDEEFKLFLNSNNLTDIDSFLQELINQSIVVPLSNNISIKIDEYKEENAHDFDWEYEDDDE